MEPLHFDHSGPQAFILAIDGSFMSLDPQNDQVWELDLSNRENQLFSLQTTFNLRVRQMRLFSLITTANQHFTSNSDFFTPPTVTKYQPDFIRVTCAPIQNAEIAFECFVSAGDTLVGGMVVRNSGSAPLNLSLGLAAVLAPMGKGTPMHPEREGINQILTGQSDELSPVLFMTGGPTAVHSPFPTLSLDMHISPGQSRRISWSLVTKATQAESLDAARQVTATPWRETAANHGRHHEAHTIHIRTGMGEWDAALYLAQVQTWLHWDKGTPGTHPAFVRLRLPDQALPTAQGMAYLNDLTLLEALHLTQILLPANDKIMARVIKSFLSAIDTNGQLPSNLNHRAFGKPFDECPLLATLCWQQFTINADVSFLKEIFLDLCRYLGVWLEPAGEQAENISAVFTNPQQLQVDTGLFNFDSWNETGRGLDIRTVQSPALLAMLHRESTSLSAIAEVLGESAIQKKYADLTRKLKAQIEATWDEQQGGYRYLDRDSKLSPSRELYFPGRVQSNLQIAKVFLEPQRLHLHLMAADDATRACRITLRGEDSLGDPIEETFRGSELRWVMQRVHLTSQKLYQSIETITMEGFQFEDRFILETADLTQSDLTCLLPVWSGAASNLQIQALLQAQLNPEDSANAYGIPETWKVRHDLPAGLDLRTNVLWNTLIIQGLSQTGQQEAAMRLFSNLMTAIVQGLRDFSGFFPYFGVNDGTPTGSPNTLAGLTPSGLFLELAGIKLFSPNKVAAWGTNPFPWPIEVHWQGLSLLREKTQLAVTFPNGEHFTTTTKEPRLISSNRQDENV